MKKFKLYSLSQSFGFALWGIYYALTRGRNLRIHFAAGALALYFSRYYALSRAELGLLIVCIGFVLTCEMINTAIEKTVDLETSTFHSLAKIAKDVAAGAVLVSAITSVVVGFLLFWDVSTLTKIVGDMTRTPGRWIIVALAVVGWIVLPQRKQEKKRKFR